MKNRVTSKDVAREAGVSRATVSYVLNNVNASRISNETREKVLKVAEDLGYQLDSIAQSLKTNKTMSIGIVSRRNIAEPRFTEVLLGIKEVLSQNHYSVVLCSDENDDKGYPEFYYLFRRKKIDAVIFISYQEQLDIEKMDNRVELVAKEQIPSVFIDYHINNPLINCVDINYEHGAYIAAKHLIDSGHKKIAFLCPSFRTEQENQRIQGIKRAVNSVSDVELIMYNAGSNKEQFSKNIQSTLKDRQNYTALIVAWGSMACQTVYQTNEMGIKVPDEISIIALAGNASANFVYPKLSTCNLPLYEAGKQGADMLIDYINKPNSPVNKILPCTLSLRNSTKNI